MKSYTCPPLDSDPQAQSSVHGVIQNSKLNGMCLPPPENQSTPALVSSI